MDFREAVEALLGASFSYAADKRASKPSPSKEKPTFMPLDWTDGMEELYQYLSGKRCIDTAVISAFVDTGSLYQTKEISKTTGKPYSNAAFIANDFNSIPQGAVIRSFYPNGFKGNHKNSNMSQYCFRHDGASQTGSSKIFVFEAPVDMLSYITLIRKKEICNLISQGFTPDAAQQSAHSWKNDSYLALGGVSPSPLLNYVAHMNSQDKEIGEIWLCLDNDMPDEKDRVPGIEAAIRMVDRLKETGFDGKIFCFFPKGKDWNDDLQKAVKSTAWRDNSWDAVTKGYISNNLHYGTKEALEVVLADVIQKHKQQQVHIQGTSVSAPLPKIVLAR